jgi:serine/threonine protein kinase
MGVVYHGTDLDGRPVTLKLLDEALFRDPFFTERLFHDAKLATSVYGPNLLRVYELFRHEDTYAIAFERVEGATLAQTIESTGALPLEKARTCAQQIARAIEDLHSKNIIHGEINSSEIILSETGEAKLTSFGLTRFLAREGPYPAQKAFMSPEKLLGSQLDNRSDIYSFGAVLFHILTGQLPAETEEVPGVKKSYREPTAPSKLNPAVPEAVDLIVLKAMAQFKTFRYQRISEVILDLKLKFPAVGQGPQAAGPQPEVQEGARPAMEEPPQPPRQPPPSELQKRIESMLEETQRPAARPEPSALREQKGPSQVEAPIMPRRPEPQEPPRPERKPPSEPQPTARRREPMGLITPEPPSRPEPPRPKRARESTTVRVSISEIAETAEKTRKNLLIAAVAILALLGSIIIGIIIATREPPKPLKTPEPLLTTLSPAPGATSEPIKVTPLPVITSSPRGTPAPSPSPVEPTVSPTEVPTEIPTAKTPEPSPGTPAVTPTEEPVMTTVPVMKTIRPTTILKTVKPTKPATKKTTVPASKKTTKPATKKTTVPASKKTTKPATKKTTVPASKKTTKPTTKKTTVLVKKTTVPVTRRTTVPATRRSTVRTTVRTSVRTTRVRTTVAPRTTVQRTTVAPRTTVRTTSVRPRPTPTRITVPPSE